MEKQYKKISDMELEETTTSTRKIDREFVEREIAALEENIINTQEKKRELETLLKQFGKMV